MVSGSQIASGLQQLQAFFNVTLTPNQLEQYLVQLPPWFDDDYDWQFAVKECMKRKFFPSIQELIEIANGTLEDRALYELDHLQELSAVGRKALDSLGGEYAFKNSENPARFRHDFIRAYVSYGRNGQPSDFKALPRPALPPQTNPELDSRPKGSLAYKVPAIGVSVDAQLGIEHDGKRLYTKRELALHRWWGLWHFGTKSQRERFRNEALRQGIVLPDLPPLGEHGNVMSSVTVPTKVSAVVDDVLSPF